MLAVKQQVQSHAGIKIEIRTKWKENRKMQGKEEIKKDFNRHK
jgi:hypothetical protein